MRILVTGAAGNIGSATVQALVEADHDVVATDIQYRRGLATRLHLADLCDANAVYGLMEGCEAVLHMGNHPSPFSVRPAHRLLSENNTMNAHVFAAARDIGVKRVVFVSSVQACAKVPPTPYWRIEPQRCVFPYLPLDGALPAHPGMNMYAMSKVFAEQYLETWAAEDTDMSLVAIRLPYVHRGEIKLGRNYFGPLSPEDHRLHEALCYLPLADASSVLHACVENAGPGYHQFFAARSAGVAGMRPSEIAAEYLPHIPIRSDLDELGELVDLRALREAVGWSPSVPLVELSRVERD